MTEAAKMAYAGHASNTQVAVRRRPRKRNTKDATVVIIQRDGRASPETFVRGIEPGSVLPRLSLMAIIIIGIHQKDGAGSRCSPFIGHRLLAAPCTFIVRNCETFLSLTHYLGANQCFSNDYLDLRSQ